MLKEFWDGLDATGRKGVGVGVVVIALLMAGFAWWTLRTEYDVLFSGLSPADAAAMTEELDKQKIPYRLGSGGTTIMVDKAQVPSARLKVMSKDIPLHGAVGFELFNNTDFGMTEFAQKINYQRALQGELTRTILSFQEIEAARVHIAFPEDGLFKKDTSRAKASVTLRVKPGQLLRAEQVSGIQRLVAAAVTGMSAADVTLVDEHGVALTRAAPDREGAAAGAEMDLKRDIEQALVRKATAMLDKAVGAGRALVSVDATLDMSQVRITKEDVTHPVADTGVAPSGVVVRERESTRDDASASSGGGSPQAGGSTTQRETEYQVGRRVEQVIGQPGSIQRLNVVAVVPGGLPPERLEQLRVVLSTAVGASADRGDRVVLQSMDAVGAASLPAATSESATAPAGPLVAAAEANSTLAGHEDERGASRATDRAIVVAVAAVALAALLLFAALLATRRRRAGAARVEPMSQAERELALRRLRHWLAEEPGDAQAVTPGAADVR